MRAIHCTSEFQGGPISESDVHGEGDFSYLS